MSNTVLFHSIRSLVNSSFNPRPSQIRTGAQIGRSLHSDAKITGTLEDALEEFRATFAVEHRTALCP